MIPFLLVLIPLSLIVLGMVLNSIPLSYDQPRSSAEQDPVKKLAAERESYRLFFDQQRSQAIRRQKRVGQYGWLLLLATIATSIWLYADTVSATARASRVSALQTLAVQEGKDMVLSLTLNDGSNVKYRVKSPSQAKPPVAPAETLNKDAISSWELEQLGTALSVGDSSLPLGIVLKIGN